MSEPINLLAAEGNLEEIQAILQRSAGVSLLPPSDSEVWRNPRYDEFFKPLIELALLECEHSSPELSDELYADFHKTGKRIHFEKVYFERRRRLGRAAIAYLRSEPGSFEQARLLASSLEKLEAIGADVAWALPAHVAVPSGKDPLQIDLFGAETANLVAELLEVFAPVIPESLRRELRRRLKVEYFDNYLKRHSEFAWIRETNNWNAVCHQGVIGAALSQLDDIPKLAELLSLAGKYLNRFIDGFEEDGGCSEGPAYWSYGFGWYAKLNAQLETRTDGMLSLFSGNAKIHEIARYGPLVVLPGCRAVNFSDCPSKCLLRPSLLSYLGHRLKEPICEDFGNYNYRRILEESIDLHRERSDFMNFSNLLLFDPGADVSLENAKITCGDAYFKDLNVVISHGSSEEGEAWHFAAKAGHNDEAHNHNDCGSYILNIGEESIVEEIGMPEYVKDYFDTSLRYDFLAARTKGHSLGVINGCEQAEGAEYNSKFVKYKDTPEALSLVGDLTASYPKSAHCARYLRSLYFDKKAPALEIVDEFELDECLDLESAVITHHEVCVKEGRVYISVGDTSVSIVPIKGTRIEGVESLAYQDHSGGEASVRRIIFKPEIMAEQSVISYRITPCEVCQQ